MGGNKKIIESGRAHLILCEGMDAYSFLINLLADIKLRELEFEEFHVYNFGGNSDLPVALKSLPLDANFKKLKSVSIIRDAERDAQSAVQSVQGALRDTGFAVPKTPCCSAHDESAKYPAIKTGFVLFPTCSASCKSGTLEDLCVDILAGENSKSVLVDVDKALAPYMRENGLRRPHKNRLHAYFSFTNEFVSLKIGEAAKARAFSWDSPQIESLKKFLRAMLGKAPCETDGSSSSSSSSSLLVEKSEEG